MENKVYVVKADTGSWDSYDWWIHGIFTDKEIAQAECDKLNTEMEKRKAFPCPIEVDEDQIDDLTEEEFDIYHKWYMATSEAKEFNQAKIVEYELGKTYSR